MTNINVSNSFIMVGITANINSGSTTSGIHFNKSSKETTLGLNYGGLKTLNKKYNLYKKTLIAVTN